MKLKIAITANRDPQTLERINDVMTQAGQAAHIANEGTARIKPA